MKTGIVLSVTTIALLTVPAFSGAQQQQRYRPAFHSLNTIGIVNGSYSSSFTIQSVFGVQLNKSFAGLGAGIDYYRFRSIPVFADLRREFGKGPNKLFLYGDIGYNYAWLTEKNKSDDFYINGNYKSGNYYAAGVGYKITFKKARALLLSIGYSHKEIKKEGTATSCPFVGPCFPTKETYLYNMPRLTLNIGWCF